MTVASNQGSTNTRLKRSRTGQTKATPPAVSDRYVLPVVHVSLPETAVNVGFWSVLVGSATLGIVDPPLAALIGAGVLIARHHRSD